MRSENLASGQVAPVSQYNSLREDAQAASFLLAHASLGHFALPTNPSNTQTLTMTVNGTAIVFTFVSSIGSTPGNVLIGGTAAVTIANLQSLFDAPDVTTTTGVALSAANQVLLSYADMFVSGTNVYLFSANVPTSALLTSFSASTTATSGTWTSDTLALIVEPGTFWINGTRVAYAGGISSDFANPAANPRIDLLCINSSGTLSITQGSENVSPTVPAYPRDKITICEVYNRHGETKILDADDSTNGYIQNDVRNFLTNNFSINQSGAEIFGGTSGGSANVQTITLTPALAAYTTGQIISFVAGFANTSATTLNVNSLGAKTIKKADGATDLANGDVKVGQTVIVMYDGTNFQMLSQGANVLELGLFKVGTVTLTNSTTTQNIAHGLSATPKLIRISWTGGATAAGSCFGYGTYNGTTTASVFVNTSGSSGFTASPGTSASNIIVTNDAVNNANSLTASVTFDGTNIILAITKAGTGCTCNLMWEAYA